MVDLKIKAESRRDARETFATLMPVSLVVVDANGKERALTACLLDVSRDGLSVILRESLTEGIRATLMTLNEDIPFVVAWTERDGDRIFRCGLSLLDATRDLRELFSTHLDCRRAG